MEYGFGVDLGGTSVKIACFDRGGTLLSKWEIPTDTQNNGRNILPDIAASILQYCNAHSIAKGQILGIGIGVPGAVERDGTVNRCVNLGWGRVNICEELGKRTGLPVAAGNDATVAALGECRAGGGQGCRNMLMITLGTGIGGGIVADGKVIHGTHGAGGEVGHIIINREETALCSCGRRGCAEQYCSATGVVRLAKKHLAASDRPSLLRSKKNLSCKDVFDAAGNGDIPAAEVLEQVYARLGQFLANLCCVLDPEIVVLGGGVSKAGTSLLQGVQTYFAHYAYHACADTRLALATLGNDAGVYGAFQLLLDAVAP